MSQQIQEQSPEETLKDLETFLDMFETEGWKKFIKMYEERAESYKKYAYQTHAANDDWQFLRGYLTVADSLIGFQENIDRAIDELKEQIAETQTDEDDSGDEFLP